MEAPPLDDASAPFYLAELNGIFSAEARNRLEALGESAFCYLHEHWDALCDADRVWLLRWGTENWPLWAAGLIARALERDGNTVALAALESVPALGEIAVPPLQALLDRFARHADPALRLAAIQAGAKNGDWQALLAVETDPAVRQAGALRLAQNEGTAAIPVLVALLDDPDWQTRAAASGALIEIGGAPVVEAVKPLARHCRQGVQAAAVQVLFALGEQAWLEQEFLAPFPTFGPLDEPPPPAAWPP